MLVPHSALPEHTKGKSFTPNAVDSAGVECPLQLVVLTAEWKIEHSFWDIRVQKLEYS